MTLTTMLIINNLFVAKNVLSYKNESNDGIDVGGKLNWVISLVIMAILFTSHLFIWINNLTW